MKTVWKFQITPSGVIRMPAGAEILTAHAQDGVPCVWALVDPSNPVEDRQLSVYGTGHSIYLDGIRYIGTAHLMNGSLVFHIFENKRDAEKKQASNMKKDPT